MAKADRILERLRREPPEMQLSEIETLLNALGWTIRKGKSSHIVLTTPKNRLLTISTVKGRSIKRKYLSGASAFIRHTRAREHLWPLRDHWADNSRGRSAPTPSLVCHFVLDTTLRMILREIEQGTG